MLPKSRLLLHIVIGLLAAYISLALYSGSAPSFVSDNLSSLSRLASKLRSASAIKATTTKPLHTSTAQVPQSTMSAVKFVPRRSEERGHAHHGWLKTFHTFSFASYYDRNHESFGPLRVLNEDRVDAYTGFDTHSHREFEIFSYVVEGALEHKDSLGNTEQLPRGTLQLTSAGTGIAHSEKAYGSSPVHFLQIWAKPWKNGLTPKYYTRRFSDEEKLGKWATVVAPYGSEGVNSEREGSGPAPVQSALTMYASILAPGVELERVLKGPKAYVHVIQTSGYKTGPAGGATVKISDVNGEGEIELREGDGVYISVGAGGGVVKAANVGAAKTEILVFDLQ